MIRPSCFILAVVILGVVAQGSAFAVAEGKEPSVPAARGVTGSLILPDQDPYLAMAPVLQPASGPTVERCWVFCSCNNPDNPGCGVEFACGQTIKTNLACWCIPVGNYILCDTR